MIYEKNLAKGFVACMVGVAVFDMPFYFKACGYLNSITFTLLFLIIAFAFMIAGKKGIVFSCMIISPMLFVDSGFVDLAIGSVINFVGIVCYIYSCEYIAERFSTYLFCYFCSITINPVVMRALKELLF